MTEEKLYAIIVAGGSGSRMKQEYPKQFINLAGIPILMYTIEAFKKFNEKIQIILVLPSEHISHWKTLCNQYDFQVTHTIVEGGKTRGESVNNGLRVLPEEGLVAIHDGVRPFVSIQTIKDSYITAQQFGTAVATVDLKDSLREITNTGSRSVERKNYKIVQTPQTFRISLIKQAYKEIKSLNYTDDASVVEAAGNKIELILGSYENIKITTPEDLLIGNEILKKL